MAEYIERLKLLKEMHGSHTLPFFIGHRTDEDIMFCQMLDIVQEQPTADVVEVKHGYWVKNAPNPEAMKSFHAVGLGKFMSENSIYWTCSCCGKWGSPIYPYCSECGAKMDGERRSE